MLISRQFSKNLKFKFESVHRTPIFFWLFLEVKCSYQGKSWKIQIFFWNWLFSCFFMFLTWYEHFFSGTFTTCHLVQLVALLKTQFSIFFWGLCELVEQQGEVRDAGTVHNHRGAATSAETASLEARESNFVKAGQSDAPPPPPPAPTESDEEQDDESVPEVPGTTIWGRPGSTTGDG